MPCKPASRPMVNWDRKRLPVDALSRVNATQEELRYVATYAPGMVLEVDRWQRVQGLAPGSYRVVGIEPEKSRVVLEDARGREVRFTPGRMRPRGEDGSLRLFEVKPLELHAGDRIRWTATDHERGLLNADQARITGIDARSVRLTTSTGIDHEIARDDPMLRRLDLAYALNAHMAQGLTSDRGIAVMDSRERKLSNQQMFLVTITRLRDGVTLYVDDAAKLGAAIERNPGMKRSALETVDLLGAAAAKGQSQAEQVNPRDAPERERSIAKPFEIGTLRSRAAQAG